MSDDLRWYQPACWIRACIRAYQRVFSARSGSHCRFLPTCSAYAIEAVELHGAVRGTWLASKRIVRCNPWGTAGFVHQPVPRPSGARDV